MIKAVYKYKRGSEQKTLSPNGRPPSGMGWLIIPSDLDREEYVRRVYETGYCMIITDHNHPLREVAIPEHILRNLKFPATPDDRGSLVSWVAVPKTEQVVMIGILQPPGSSSPYKEGTLVEEIDSTDTRVSRLMSIKDKSYNIAITSDEGDQGGFSVKVQGPERTTSMTFNLDGTASIKSDQSLEIFAEEEMKLQMASKEDEISTLTLSKEGVLAYLDRYGNDLKITEDGYTYQDEFGNRLTITEGSYQFTDDAGNDFDMNTAGFHLENNFESFITLMNDTLKMYMQTKTIDGKVLDPASVLTAVDLIRRFNTLFN